MYALCVLWRDLQQNHRPGESILLSTLGLGNHVSMLRGLFIGLLAGFLFAPRPADSLAWLIALLYTAASIADWLDGYIARRTNHSTILGQRLDMEFDGLGVLIVSLLAIGYEQLPIWFLSIALVRYLFVFGLWWRRRTGRPVYDMPPSIHRRIMAGMMMGFMTVVLWPIVPAAMATVAAYIIAIPVLLGFSRDWLFTSGRLQTTNPAYRRLQRALYLLVARGLPFLWRLLLPLTMLQILLVATPWYQPQAWLDLLLSWHVPIPAVLATLLCVTAVLGTILIFFGIAGRLAAITLFFPIGFDITTRGLLWSNALALTCALCIALFGTGRFSMWQPDEKLVTRRSGEEEDKNNELVAKLIEHEEISVT
jgi:CDP-diacylglycerol--glycerol-3-phosphate 3-phosphatidyltransferase